MAWDRPILTDSGGFQVVSLGDLRVIDDDGVTFRSHLDGSTHRFTPEHAIAVQEALGADIAVAFDQPVYPSSPRAVVADATERTHRWAERSLAAHTRTDQALFGVIQGGLEPDLREESTRFIAELPFDGICIGGLAGDETPAQRDATLDVVVPLLADDPRPRYLMGLGSPADLLDAVDQGIDLFDSVLPARVARTGQVWVPGGRLNLRNAPSSTTRGRSRTAVRACSAGVLAGLHRPSVPGRELLAYRLATCHNLTFTLDFMAGSAPAIPAGTFPESMPDCACERAGPSGGAGAVKRREGSTVPCSTRGGTHGLSRSTAARSQEEAEGQVRPPKVQPLAEPPMNVELIRKPASRAGRGRGAGTKAEPATGRSGSVGRPDSDRQERDRRWR